MLEQLYSLILILIIVIFGQIRKFSKEKGFIIEVNKLDNHHLGW
jgi:hypothetical protein